MIFILRRRRTVLLFFVGLITMLVILLDIKIKKFSKYKFKGN